MLNIVKRQLKKLRRRRYDYQGDVLAVRKVNTGFLNDKEFSDA